MSYNPCGVRNDGKTFAMTTVAVFTYTRAKIFRGGQFSRENAPKLSAADNFHVKTRKTGLLRQAQQPCFDNRSLCSSKRAVWCGHFDKLNDRRSLSLSKGTNHASTGARAIARPLTTDNSPSIAIFAFFAFFGYIFPETPNQTF